MQTIKSRHSAARRGVWLMFARVFTRGFDTAWTVGSTFLPLHRLDSEYSSFRNKIPECGNIGIKRGGPLYVLREADDAYHRRLRSCLRGSGL